MATNNTRGSSHITSPLVAQAINTLVEQNGIVEKVKALRNSKIKAGKARKSKMKITLNNKATGKPNEDQVPSRRRVKRKVRKNRRSRDELRQRLHMRLISCNAVAASDRAPGENVGTGCSYRADNNNRISGFAVGSKCKVTSECIWSDSTESEFDILSNSYHRSTDSTFRRGRWDDTCFREASLLEDIWRHLQAIVERSKMLKGNHIVILNKKIIYNLTDLDSSSSRRRSNSLTSTDTSVVRRSVKPKIHKTENMEMLNQPEEEDESDDSNSDKGYYTHGNCKGAFGGLRVATQDPFSPLRSDVLHNDGTGGNRLVVHCKLHKNNTDGCLLVPSTGRNDSCQKVYELLENCCTFSSSANVIAVACPSVECTITHCNSDPMSVISSTEPIMSSDTCNGTLGPHLRKREKSLADRDLWKSEICKDVLTPPKQMMLNHSAGWRKRVNSGKNYVVISPTILLRKTSNNFVLKKDESESDEKTDDVSLHVAMEIQL